MEAVQEIWKNSTQSKIFVARHGPNSTIRHELVAPGRNFTITVDERRMNQNLAANDSLDIFSNGWLQPVQLPEETASEIADNPNHIPDEQLPGFFKLHYKTFAKRLEQITNPAVLERLREIGPENDATVKQIDQIQARINEINPPPAAAALDEMGLPRVKPVTPR
jgi:hypothetical protein